MTTAEIADFEKTLLDHVEMCYRVAFSLTKDAFRARRLTEVTVLGAAAERQSLDLTRGIKMALLARLRANFLRESKPLPAARQNENIVPLDARKPRRVAHMYAPAFTQVASR